MIATDLSSDDLLEVLADLKHDLGKYLRMPLAMLPGDASRAEVEAALRTAVFETRRGPKGVRGAMEIWNAFLAEAGRSAAAREGFAPLEEAVETAVAWGTGDRAPDRDLALADMSRVSESIQKLIEEVADEDR